MNNKRGCEYLLASLNTITNASKNICSFDEDDFGNSITLIHKAWNNLWQADIVYSANGTLTKPGGDYLYGIEDYLNKNDSLEFKQADSIVFQSASSEIHQNINLFRHIRNKVIHEYLPIEFDSLYNFLIPYIRANFKNFCDSYEKLYYYIMTKDNPCNKTKDENNRKNRNHADCKRNLLLLPDDLRKKLILPTSIYDLWVRKSEYELSTDAYHELPNELKEKIKDICASEKSKANEEIAYFMDHNRETQTTSTSFTLKPVKIERILNNDSTFPFVFSWQYMQRIYRTNNFVKIKNKHKTVTSKGKNLVRWYEAHNCLLYSLEMVTRIKEASQNNNNEYDSERFANFVGIDLHSVKFKDKTGLYTL